MSIEDFKDTGPQGKTPPDGSIEYFQKNIEHFTKKMREICYAAVSIKTYGKKDSEEYIEILKEEIADRGIQIEAKDLELIIDLIKKNKSPEVLRKIETYKKYLKVMREEFIPSQKEGSFAGMMKGNDDLDNFMLFELATREIKEGENPAEEIEIMKKIENVLENVDIFNDYKDEYTYLKEMRNLALDGKSINFSEISEKTRPRVNNMEALNFRIEFLKQKMYEIFLDKNDNVADIEYSKIFVEKTKNNTED